MTPQGWRTVGWLAAGAGQLAAWTWVRQLGDLSIHVPSLWWAMLPVMASWTLAAILLRTHSASAAPVILAIALGSRLLLLDTEPTLSDDIYRYVWDGRVQAAGLNPYAQAPDDAALTDLRNDDWSRINHPELVTVYPPVAQWFFRGALLAGGGVTAMKLALVLCDLLLIAVLWRWLCERGQDGRRVVLYAWHPLPVLEIAGSGHIDVLGVLLLCLALLWLHGRRHLAATWVLGAAILTKLIPVLGIAAFWQQLGSSNRAFQHQKGWQRFLDPRSRLVLLWIPVLLAAAWLPYAGAGDAMWSGLTAYATRWRSNDSAFGVIYWLLSDPAPGWTWDDDALLLARGLGLAAVALTMVWFGSRPRVDPASVCAWLFGLQLLLAPTVHPWYLLWVLPFLVLRFNAAWMAFCWLVLLAYNTVGVYRQTGVWLESELIRALQYVPIYALLIWPLLQRLLRRDRQEQASRPDVC